MEAERVEVGQVRVDDDRDRYRIVEVGERQVEVEWIDREWIDPGDPQDLEAQWRYLRLGDVREHELVPTVQGHSS